MTDELRRISRHSMIVVTNGGRQLVGGRAVLFVLQTVGWHPSVMRFAARRPLVWVIDAGYRLVANNRQFFSRFFFRNR